MGFGLHKLPIRIGLGAFTGEMWCLLRVLVRMSCSQQQDSPQGRIHRLGRNIPSEKGPVELHDSLWCTWRLCGAIHKLTLIQRRRPINVFMPVSLSCLRRSMLWSEILKAGQDKRQRQAHCLVPFKDC